MKDLEMTQTDRRPTDRPTSRDASHLKMYNTWVSDIKKFVLGMLASALNLTEFYFSHFQMSNTQVLYHFGIVRPNADEWL